MPCPFCGRRNNLTVDSCEGFQEGRETMLAVFSRDDVAIRIRCGYCGVEMTERSGGRTFAPTLYALKLKWNRRGGARRHG